MALLPLKNVRDGRDSVKWRDAITNDVILEGDANAENDRLMVETPEANGYASASAPIDVSVECDDSHGNRNGRIGGNRGKNTLKCELQRGKAR